MDILNLVQNENIKRIIIEKKEVLTDEREACDRMIDMRLCIRILYEQQSTNEVKLKVSDYLHHWLYDVKRHELKASSFDRKEQVVENQIIPHIGDVGLHTLKMGDIQNMINALSEVYSYSTVKKAYECINACLKFAVKEGKLQKNPCELVVLPKKQIDDVKEIRAFTDGEITKIEQECVRCYQNGKRIYRVGEIVILLLNTGLRIGEALALEWTDVDFEHKRLKIRKNVVYVKKRSKDGRKAQGYQTVQQNTPKTKSGDRIIPLNQEAVMALMAVKTINGNCRYVFATRCGKRIHPRNIDRMFRSVLRNCEIKGAGVHTLRHTFASRLFASGVDVKTVSQLLGHSEVGVTYDTYIHLIQEQEIKAVQALEKL